LCLKGKTRIRIADESDSVIESAGEGIFTCFKFISSKLEPEGAKSSGEESGIMMSDVSG